MIEIHTASPAMTGIAAGLQPLRADAWRRAGPPVLAFAILLASLWQLRAVPPREIVALVPASPVFWLLFAASYLVLPLSEWLIFYRLWRVPPAAFAALLRKRVSNEVLLGYSGEVYFYTWARRHAKLVNAPFGAIKDTAILSAAVGNAVTLVLVVVSWPLLRALDLGLAGHALAVSILVIAVSSLAVLGLRRTLFSLPASDLRFIAAVHLARVLATMVLAAALWASVLPAAPLGWWVALSAVRMLVWRLPFVPTKDVVFAGVVSLLIGHAALTADMLAMIAGLVLVTNLILGATLGLSELFGLAER